MESRKTALVTGSMGFIGQHLCRRLQEDGWHLYLSDLKNGHNFLQLEEIPEDVDVIFHLACINQQEALEKPVDNLLCNGYGTRHLHEISRGVPIIYTSTASVYGKRSLNAVESQSLDPQTEYAAAKLLGEHYLSVLHDDWVILRLSNVYGPGQTTENPYCGVIGRFAEEAKAYRSLPIIGNGEQTRDFTYIDDVIDVIMGIWDNPEANRQIINVGTGKETSILDLAVRMTKNDIIKTGFPPRANIDGIQRRKLNTKRLNALGYSCETDLDTGLSKMGLWQPQTSLSS